MVEGLTLAELEAQVGGLLSNRVEMKKHSHGSSSSFLVGGNFSTSGGGGGNGGDGGLVENNTVTGNPGSATFSVSGGNGANGSIMGIGNSWQLGLYTQEGGVYDLLLSLLISNAVLLWSRRAGFTAGLRGHPESTKRWLAGVEGTAGWKFTFSAAGDRLSRQGLGEGRCVGC